MKTITKNRTQLQTNWVDPMPAKGEGQYPKISLSIIRFLFGFLGRIFPKKAGAIAYKLFTTPRVRARHNSSDSIIESARVFEFLYAKRMLKVYEWGSGDKVVLLVHGWESRGTAMRTFVPNLLAQGYRVVAFDGPAHGNSGGKRTNLPNFAGAIKAVINHIGGVDSIITHSFGGPSTMYALSAIDNSLKVRNMVMIAGPSQMSMVWQNTVNILNVPPKAAAHFRFILERKVNMTMEQIDSPLFKNKMKVDKMLVVHDQTDKIIPFSQAEANYADIEMADLLEVNGFGHYRLMKNPDLINYVTDFIG